MPSRIANRAEPVAARSAAPPPARFAQPGGPRPPASPTLEALAAQYERGDYRGEHGGVLRSCAAALVSAEIARLCLHAACSERDVPEAKRWLPFASDAERVYCQSRGIGQGTSTLDCRHNPLDCR